MNSFCERPVFIIGSGRCGTSILRRILADSCGLKAANFEVTIFTDPALSKGIAHYADFLALGRAEQRAAWLGELDEFLRRKFLIEDRYGKRKGYHQYLERDEFDALLAALFSAYENADTADALEKASAIFSHRLHGRMDGKNGGRRWLNDCPFNANVVDEIAAIHPDALFLHPIRDGRAVAASMMRRGWKDSPQRAIEIWSSRVNAARRSGAKLPDDQYLEIDFRNLIDNPKNAFDRIFAFIDIAAPSPPEGFKPERARKFAEDGKDWNALLQKTAPDLVQEFGWLD